MRVVVWGTYDLGKPRTEILLRGLRQNGVEILECHADPWRGVEDKSQIKGRLRRLGYLLRWFASYPGLLVRYLWMPPHDVVLVCYLGQLDVLLLRPLAKLRGVPVVWDVLISLYNTVVEERGLVGRRHPLAVALYVLEWLSLRAADRLVFVTDAHRRYVEAKFGLSDRPAHSVFVGCASDLFSPRAVATAPPSPDLPVRVLFYSQFIPLHGSETIVRAAQELRDEPFEWVIIGRGQEEARIRQLLDERPVPALTWLPWVPYGELKDWIHRADVGLGIFGTSSNAAMVIPNKVYQVLATGTPLVTRDSPAMRELVSGEEPGLVLVPPADVPALVAVLRRFRGDRAALLTRALFPALRLAITPPAIARRMEPVLAAATAARRGRRR